MYDVIIAQPPEFVALWIGVAETVLVLPTVIVVTMIDVSTQIVVEIVPYVEVAREAPVW